MNTNVLSQRLFFSAAGYLFAKASKAAAFAIGASVLGLAVRTDNDQRTVDMNFSSLDRESIGLY